MYDIDYKKYLLVLVITAGIFAMALYASGRLNSAKIDELRAIQDRIAIDLLSSEMQFSLIEEASCEDIGNPILSRELDNLSSKLSYAEQEINSDEEEIMWLKKNYTLFELRDYLLSKKLSEKCAEKPVSILYFYSNAGDCADCKKQGLILTELRGKYPGLRVYSFDYRLDLSALQTLIEIHKIQDNLPVLLIKRKAYYGFQDEPAIEKALPELKTLATSTEKTL